MRQQPFEAIVARHGPTVLRLCRAVLGPVEADDAWSETFLAAVIGGTTDAARRSAADGIANLRRRYPVPES